MFVTGLCAVAGLRIFLVDAVGDGFLRRRQRSGLHLAGGRRGRGLREGAPLSRSVSKGAGHGAQCLPREAPASGASPQSDGVPAGGPGQFPAASSTPFRPWPGESHRRVQAASSGNDARPHPDHAGCNRDPLCLVAPVGADAAIAKTEGRELRVRPSCPSCVSGSITSEQPCEFVATFTQNRTGDRWQR